VQHALLPITTMCKVVATNIGRRTGSFQHDVGYGRFAFALHCFVLFMQQQQTMSFFAYCQGFRKRGKYKQKKRIKQPIKQVSKEITVTETVTVCAITVLQP
jgi:hypothetical protein